MAGGFTMSLPTEDRSYSSKMEMGEEIVVLLGGRVAEALILGDISTGASNDIERATKMANAMVTRYGMSDIIGPIVYGGDSDQVFLGRDMGQSGRNYSEKIAAEIDDEIKKIILNAYKLTEQILKDNIEKLHSVAKFLIEHEKMSGEEFDLIMKGTPLEVIEEKYKEDDSSESKIEVNDLVVDVDSDNNKKSDNQ